MSHRQLHVNLDEVVEAMDTHFDGAVEWFLDTRTGAIHSIDAEDCDDSGEADDDGGQADGHATDAKVRADPDRFVGIPQTESHEAYRVMEEFIATVSDARLRERLADAIAGKGAFRRFKNVLLDHPRVREEWFRFESQAKRQWAAEWLASIDIESTWKPARAPTDPPP